MEYLLRVTDAGACHMVVLTLPEELARQPAVDVVFDVLGNADFLQLVARGIITDGQIDDLQKLKNLIFDSDAQGQFIRENISFKLAGRELDPDAPLLPSFTAAERNGIKYMRCDLVVQTGQQERGDDGQSSQLELVEELSRLFFLHQLATGSPVDVTKDYPELMDTIAYAEKKGWIEVDVNKAAYRLTAEGKRVHDDYMRQAQDLIRRFDIYADVDVDSAGTARFDTGLGKDLRVAALEMEAVDPFRARFLLGLNDSEWNELPDWMERFRDPTWYAQIFEPVENAPSIDDIGRSRLAMIMEQAKAVLRQQQIP